MIQCNHSRSLVAILKGMICIQRMEKRNGFFKDCWIGIHAKRGLKRSGGGRFQKSAVPDTSRSRQSRPWPKVSDQIVMNVLNVLSTQHANEFSSWQGSSERGN